MKISGYKKREISTIDGKIKLAYDMDLSISSNTGEALFGVSGYTGDADSAANSKKTQFTFKSGRIFDPENRCISSYKADKAFNLKGTFLASTYDYFIDNSLICSVGSKEDFKIRNFFFDTTGCEIELINLKIYSKRGKVDLLNRSTFSVFGPSGTSGTGSNIISGSSSAGSTITLSNAVTFNSGVTLEGSILSGKVILGSGDFKFDDSVSNISYLSGITAGSKKDLRLIAQTELFEKDYPLTLDLYTTFGDFSESITLQGLDPFNPSGINMKIGEGSEDMVTTGYANSLTTPSGDSTSGEFIISYSVSDPGATEKASGLPFKIYLEHVSGDHSKNYSFITGAEISGAGLGYDSSSFDDLAKDLIFRTGKSGASPSTLSGSVFGNKIKDRAIGLVSSSTGFDTQINEVHIASIRTNLHTGTSAGSGTFNIASGLDKALFTSYENVVDIVSIFDSPDSPSATTKINATGIPKVLSYIKPASDWQLFTGATDSEDLTQHTATGSGVTPLMRHYYTGGNSSFLRAVVKTRNHLDRDPMVYKLVFSGTDDFVEEKLITGTVMATGYETPYIPADSLL